MQNFPFLVEARLDLIKQGLHHIINIHFCCIYCSFCNFFWWCTEQTYFILCY